MAYFARFLSIERPYVWLIASLPLFVPSFFVPMSSDNSLYQSMAFDLISFGRLPYLGSWDQNFPGIVAIHSIVLLLFGGSDLAFRIFDVLFQIALCIVLFKLLSQYTSPIFSGLAVLLYVIYYGRNDYMFFGQRELFAHGLLIASIWYRHHRPQRLLISGLLLGAAALTKPTVAVIAMPLILLLPTRITLKGALSLGAASSIPIVIVIAIYSLFPGGLTELYLATIRFNAEVYGGTPASLWQFFAMTQRHAFIYPLALIGGWLIIREGASTHVMAAYCIALTLSIAMVLIQGKLLIYHYSTFFLLLCVPAAAVIERLYVLLRLRPLHVGLAVTIFVVLLSGRRPAISTFAEQAGQIGALDSAYDATDRFSVSMPSDVDRVIAYIGQFPGSRVEVISHHARLRDKLRREPATRFTLLHPVGLYTGPTRSPIFTAYQHRWRKEFVDALVSVKPEFIVIARNTPCFQLVDPWNSVLVSLPGFPQFLEANYRLDSTIANFEIYRRNRS